VAVNNTDIIVSICCLTYNHEHFIADAIDGFLMQKTDFPIEILIHDDASTDKTAEIIRKYQTKNPGRIEAIFQTDNQFSQGRGFAHFFSQAKGKYIAECEGDDYWTNRHKLQK